MLTEDYSDAVNAHCGSFAKCCTSDQFTLEVNVVPFLGQPLEQQITIGSSSAAKVKAQFMLDGTAIMRVTNDHPLSPERLSVSLSGNQCLLSDTIYEGLYANHFTSGAKRCIELLSNIQDVNQFLSYVQERWNQLTKSIGSEGGG